VRHNVVIPPLLVESLNFSSIASGSPSPLLEWSNKTEKHLGLRLAPPQSLQQQQPGRRLSATTVNSDNYTPQEFNDLLMLLLPDHSQVDSSISSPTACSSSKRTPSTSATLRPERHPTALTPAPSAPHSPSRVSLSLNGAFVAAASASALAPPPAKAASDSEQGGSEPPSLSTPANILQTPKKAADGPDLSLFTASTTSVGGTVTPTVPHGKTSVWQCDVSREEEGEDGEGGFGRSDDGYGGDNKPTDTPQPRKSFLGSRAVRGAADEKDCEVQSDPRDSSDDSLHRSLFPCATEIYISAHPSAAPFPVVSENSSCSPIHPRAPLADRAFAAQYPLFQPDTHSPHQGSLPVHAAQATPSCTELLTNVFAESATVRQTLPQFGGETPAAADGGRPRHYSSPMCAAKSPDRRRTPQAQYPPRSIAADAPIRLHLASPSHSLHSHRHPSPSSGEADMDTQVFRSGTHVFSPILQRHHVTSSKVTFVGEGSLTPQKFIYRHFCSPLRTSTTPTRRLHDTVAVASPADAVMENIVLDDTFFSLRSQPDAARHNSGSSSPRTPHNVSAVVEHSGSDSMASSLLLPCFDGVSCGAQSLSMSGAAGPPNLRGGRGASEHRSNTPKSPHTPLDRRTPGVAGIHGGNYTSLSEYSCTGVPQHRHRQLPSQPMTPQKSARRNYSRQTTPSQSFRSKVQSHSFESQQPQQQQQASFFNAAASGLWTAKGQANTPVSSVALGEATIVAERDYLAPSRNPFSLYRLFEMYASPVLTPEHTSRDGAAPETAKYVDDSASSDATIKAHSTDQPLTAYQNYFVNDLAKAVLRPDAAVVLYEQLIPAPTRAPGSHRPGAKAPTPSQAALNLLLHTQHPITHVFTPGSLSLSLSGRGAQGKAWKGGAAPAAAAPVVAEKEAPQDKREDENSVDRATTSSAFATPPRVRDVSNAVADGQTVPHKEAFLHSTTAAVDSLKPKITLANCSPRHAPSAAPLLQPHIQSNHTIGQQNPSSTADAPAGVRTASPFRLLNSPPPHSAVYAVNASASPKLLCEEHGHDETVNTSATSSSYAAAARNLSKALMSFTTLDDADDAITGKDDASRATDDDDDEDGDNHDDHSPPPRRPTSKYDYDECRQPTPHASSPVCPVRQLQFGTESTEDDNVEKEMKRCEAAAAAQQVPDVPSPVAVLRPTPSPFVTVKEVSTGTESSMVFPHYLHNADANVHPHLERPSSPLQLHLNLLDALQSRAMEDGNSRADTATLPPSSAASPAPMDKFVDLLRTPDVPPCRPPPPPPHHQHQLQQPRQYTPPQDAPELRLPVELNCAHSSSGRMIPRTFSADRAGSSNEVASLLSPSAYQALGSALDPLDMTDISEEEVPGDRFQAHHEFQFLHYVEAALETAAATTEITAATAGSASDGASAVSTTNVTASTTTPITAEHHGVGRPIPLCVEVNGVTWLATHRLNGLPYAVKEVPAAAFNVAELQCLTLSNNSPHSLHRQMQAERAGSVTAQDVLEAEDYLARYYSVSTPPQDTSKPVVHLLQLEYFPRGSLHEFVQRSLSSVDGSSAEALPQSLHTPSPAMGFDCDFWEQVVQHGLRGLRALHHAGLLHGCPLPSCLFFAGHTTAQTHVKWSCFGNARANADVYPTESLPSWISEAVSLLYTQYEGEGTVPVDVVEVAVFCLGVLELLVEQAAEREQRRGMHVLSPAATSDGLCRLAWMEAIVRCEHHHHNDRDDEEDEGSPARGVDEARLQAFMQFLWNTANSYIGTDAVLAQMAVHIDPALHTVEELYQHEIDRLRRQLQERKRTAKQRRRPRTCRLSPPRSHHERVDSLLSQNSIELLQTPQSKEEGRPCTTRAGSGTVSLLPCSPRLVAGHGLANAMRGTPSLDATQLTGLGPRNSPQLLPCRASAPSGRHLSRASFVDVGAEHLLPSPGAGGEFFLPSSNASGKLATASAPMLPLKVGLVASQMTPRGTVTTTTATTMLMTGRRDRLEVHPWVREAALVMLMNSLMSPRGGDSLTLSSVWRALLRPAVYSLRLRGWMSLYAGLPLPVTGAGMSTSTTEEALLTLLASLRPMTSYE
jgi:hypothetical protein